MVAWALVPRLNLAVIRALGAADWARTGVPSGELLNRAAVSFAVLLSLWGVARIAAELRALRPALASVVEEEEPDVERLFQGIGSILVPLLLMVAASVILPLDEAMAGDPVGALIQAGTWLLIGIPLWTAVWVYLALQMGLNRLGRGHLTLQPYRGDRSLGLRPVGRLAFTGFWMLVGSVGALVLTGRSDLPGVVLGIGVLVAGAAEEVCGILVDTTRTTNAPAVATSWRRHESAQACLAGHPD